MLLTQTPLITGVKSEVSNWLYSQIYIQNPQTRKQAGLDELRAVCDRLIMLAVQEWINHFRLQGWLEQFFFIRYAEEGYHVRLRLKGQPQDLLGPVQTYLDQKITAFFCEHQGILWQADMPLNSQTLKKNGALRYAVYEPEYEKYCGPYGLEEAERHFEVSSQICFQVLEAESGSRIPRSQFSLELMNILFTAYGAGPHETAFILKGYTAYWLGLVQPEQQAEMITSLENNYQRLRNWMEQRFNTEQAGTFEASWQKRDAGSNLFQQWRQHLNHALPRFKHLEKEGLLLSPITGHVAQQQALLSQFPAINDTPTTALLILPNFLHMLNNRLGLTPLQEVQLTHLFYRYLEDSLGIEADFYTLILEPTI